MDEENAEPLFIASVYIINSGDSIVACSGSPADGCPGTKLVQGAPLGRPEEEGYIPRGIKRNAFAANLPQSAL
jgi:hypothetical protein